MFSCLIAIEFSLNGGGVMVLDQMKTITARMRLKTFTKVNPIYWIKFSAFSRGVKTEKLYS